MTGKLASLLYEHGLYNENEQLLASLYKEYLPTTGKTKAKTFNQWLSKAINNKDVRQYLLHIAVLRGNVIATDGHRLHMVPNVGELSEGYYDANMTRLDDKALGYDVSRFPNYERVIPNVNKDYTGYVINLDDCEVYPHDKKVVYKIVFDDKVVHLNKRYLDDAVNMNREVELYIKDEVSPVVILNSFEEGSVAVVMPINGGVKK